ncbi:MAG: gamma-glutamyltransferase [Candidatus Omnitrophica bacterium]|nr:gamma-glutamyltransferase [Candidatus Omnitrophota bacterium]
MTEISNSKPNRFEHLKFGFLNLFRISDLEFRIFSSILLSSFFLLSSPLFAAESKHAMVATADPHSTRAALEVLQKGGNAVDAAIAAQWVLNVVEPQGSGIGGGGFFLYYEAATKHVYSFDGREAAPGDAYPEMFLDPKTGEPYPFYPSRITGGLSVGVPGVLKMLQTVHDRFGSEAISFGDLFLPAIKLARNGFPVSSRLAKLIDQEKDRLKLFPASAKIFLDTKGDALAAGAILFQPDLAGTFEWIRKDGIDIFYAGDIARDIVRAVRTAPFHPGLMSFPDLENYKVNERAPVRGSYRGYDLYSMGPPSSGGLAILQALQILELYDLSSLGRSVKGLHLLAEAQTIAFEDRSRYLGDPAYSQIPLEKLLSKNYARERSQEINWEFARNSLRGKLHNPNLEGIHTTHISIVDEQGNMVAFTTTIESVFGSGIVVPGRGFVLNNELTDFDLIKSAIRNPKSAIHPNAPEGDKRPRSSMTPTFVFRNGQPFMIVGSPGGSTIIGTVLNIIVNVIDFEMKLADAIQAPKLIHRGEFIEMESGLYQQRKILNGLGKLHHTVMLKESFGNAQVILFDLARRVITGASDPRGEGEAKGY